MTEALRMVIKRQHYLLEVRLTCVRWYVPYPLSPRHIEEIMAERCIFVDHATVHRWSLKIWPALAEARYVDREPGAVFQHDRGPMLLRKVDHRLIDVLVIAVCGVIAYAERWDAIALYGRSKLPRLGTFLEIDSDS